MMRRQGNEPGRRVVTHGEQPRITVAFGEDGCLPSGWLPDDRTKWMDARCVRERSPLAGAAITRSTGSGPAAPLRPVPSWATRATASQQQHGGLRGAANHDPPAGRAVVPVAALGVANGQGARPAPLRAGRGRCAIAPRRSRPGCSSTVAGSRSTRLTSRARLPGQWCCDRSATPAVRHERPRDRRSPSVQAQG